MQDISTEFQDRKKKVEILEKEGVNPYPERFKRTHTAVQARAKGEKGVRETDEVIKKPRPEVKLAGRLMTFRPHGKIAFGQLQDATGRIQICLAQNVLGKEKCQFFEKKIDIGDHVGVTGELFITKHKELTLLMTEFQLLSKTLRSLPEKWHGLQDTEAKYRSRYLDLVMNRETYDRFLLRTRIISMMRKYLDEHEFMEVETPILSGIPSGATAKPFSTHHNALDHDFYLRIAPETYLKRCIAGGLERVYEFAKCFRNEGMDPSHLQEFTMLEYYVAYWNFEDNMRFTEEFISFVIKEIFGTLKIHCRSREGSEQEIDFTPPWPRKKFVEMIEEDCGINILDCYGNAKKLRKIIAQKKISIEGMEKMGYGNLCDALYKKVSRPKLIQPMFVILHPVDTKPLARRNDKDARLADTFQLLVNTWEIVNAYSEIVNPIDQKKRLEDQAKARESGDEEAMPMDEDFIRALEHGLPPTSGWGMGIDRFLALITKQDNLKDVVLFPLLKPLE